MAQLKQAFDDIDERDAAHVAALDIGSNSFHLVIARIIAGSVQILHKIKQHVRLAEGLDENGYLSADAQERGLDALRHIADSLNGFAPGSVRIVATYTLRKAVNASDFIKAAKTILPYPVEVISGVEEARLIYQGVAHTTDTPGRRLVIDIGGGSTEFALGEGFESQQLRSTQMGCVSFTKRFFNKGKLTERAFRKAITGTQQELELMQKKFRKLGWDAVIGTSGTIKALTMCAQSINPNLPRDTLTLAELERIKTLCIQQHSIDTLNLPGISDDRRPVIAAGLAILLGAFRSLNIDSMQFSPAALREGVLYEMEDKMAHRDIRERTAESLAVRYDVDTVHAKKVLTSAFALFDDVARSWALNDEHRQLLGWAALLHEVGLQINSRGVQRHSGYILNQADLPGFNQEQQLLLATLARFHRKKVRTEEFPTFSQYSGETLARLITLLQLAVTLNVQRQDTPVTEFSASANGAQIELQFGAQWLENAPLLAADIENVANNVKNCGITLVTY